MRRTTYSDVERFGDDTGRWLWRILFNDRLLEAGIEDSFEQAAFVAASHLETICTATMIRFDQSRVTDQAEPSIDFDALEKGM